MRRSLFLLFLSTVAVGVLATSGMAATQTYSYHRPASGPLEQPVFWEEFINVPKWDPLVGLLTGVTVNLSGHITGYAQAANTSTTHTASITDMQILGTIFLSSTDVPSLNMTLQASTPQFAPITLSKKGNPGDTWTSAASDGVAPNSPPYHIPPPGDLIAWTLGTGLDSVMLKINADARLRSDKPSYVTDAAQVLAGADVYVEYEYVEYEYQPPAVPEMGSLVLAGLGGFVGLPFWRRMRK